MDKDTRNSLQRATQAARRTLEEEFAAQLEGVYDIRPDGTVAAEAGRHLTEDGEAQRARVKLVTAIQHHREQGRRPADAVAALLRESAFTTLNRFVALKMLEAREIVKPCVSQGPLSGGFKEFTGLAPGLATLPDQGYRLYLDSLFDEIGREVKVLFDRRDPASLLWPRKPALDALLGILNDTAFGAKCVAAERGAEHCPCVWCKDETIGWVYQYFNGEDERRQMRAESQAPRNSRELAVRNQFFTPRYVVEFLTDNTLGRTWVEMQRGDTRLVETCRYLVKRPSEVFLAEGATEPVKGDAALADSRPLCVPFRAKKDPRDLRVLDPACGSGHFLLYGFDLMLVIYEEAWADVGSPASEVTGRSLASDYPTRDALRRALPGLVLRHNLYGVDIDPRAAQIAALALWMRAQRAWTDLGFKRAERPLVTRTNIVVAEPMPGEPDLLDALCAGLDRPVANIVRSVFEDMKLAGEAGTLLRIEDTVRRGVEQLAKVGGLFAQEDERRWERLGGRVYDALRVYAESVGGAGYRRRLFAEDAARGFAFIDLCRHSYDVVLMNPPFGEWSATIPPKFFEGYVTSSVDIGAAFVIRGGELASAAGGRTGALTNRTFLSTSQLAAWRREALLSEAKIESLADLGFGVLDAAMVEAAAYVVAKSPVDRLTSVLLLNDREKDSALLAALASLAAGRYSSRVNTSIVSEFAALPLSLVAHWAPRDVVGRLLAPPRLRDLAGGVNDGGHTGDDPRFLRASWEVSPEAIGRDKTFVRFAKGGEYAPFWDDLHLVANWGSAGHEVRAVSGARVYHEDLHFRAGLTYPLRTTSDWSPRVLPEGVLFSTGGHGVHFDSIYDATLFLGFAYTRLMKLCCEVLMGGGDASVSGSAARNYTAGTMAWLPRPKVVNGSESRFRDLSQVCILLARRENAGQDESSVSFLLPRGVRSDGSEKANWHLSMRFMDAWRSRLLALAELSKASASFESASNDALGIASSSFLRDVLDETYGPHPETLRDEAPLVTEVADVLELNTSELAARLAREQGANRSVTKKSYFVDRDLELIARLLNCSLRQVLTVARQLPPPRAVLKTWASDLVSWAAGVAFGRFDLRLATGDRPFPPEPEPFDRLPACSPGMLTNDEGLPVRVPFPGYPMAFPVDGILVDDPGVKRDLLAAIRGVFEVVFGEGGDERLAEAVALLDPRCEGLRPWLRSAFFAEHIQRYSKSRRKAPIYWRFGTPSGSYSVWLYMHRVGPDTLHAILRDHVEPKLRYEEDRWHGLSAEAGLSPSTAQRRELAVQESFVHELRAFRDELLRVAPLWNPDLDDGVVINASFLHRLFLHTKSWANECEGHWEKLKAGECDWSHLAMRLWPERVVPKCVDDRSLAIAHGLEDALWVENDDGKWTQREVDEPTIQRLVASRTSAAVKAALREVSAAPPPTRVARAVRPTPAAQPPRERAAKQRAAQLPLDLSGVRAGADKPALDALRMALHQFPDGAGKSELLTASGLDEAQWMPAITELVETGEVERTGQKRGTRYTLRAGGIR